MSGLPKGWVEARLDDLAAVNPGKLDRVAPQASVSFIPMPAVSEIDGEITGATTRPFHEVSKGYTQFQEGDVIFAKITPCMENGKTAVARSLENRVACGSTEFHVVRPLGGISPDYLWRFLRQAAFRADAERSMTGAVGQRRVPAAYLKESTLPLPPLPEQRRIVAKIDSLTAKSRRARDHLDHIPRLVEKYKQAILAAAFRGDLTREWRAARPQIEAAAELVARTQEPVQSRGGREATTAVKPGLAGLSVNDPGTPPPQGWLWIPLRRIARQETGHTPSRSKPNYWDGGIPWLGIRDAGAHHGAIITETLQTISEDGLANSSARLLPAGTVCLSRTASVGYVTVMGRPMATSQDFATWTCTDALMPAFLMYALMAEGDSIRDFGEGSTHTTIYFPEIRALHICLGSGLITP